MSRAGLICIAALVGIASGLGLSQCTGSADFVPSTVEAVSLGDRRPAFDLAGLEDEGRFTAAQFDGRPLLINFWATWCAPCVREMPMLDAFHREHGQRVALLGIAHDRPEAARAFVEQTGVSYPIALGGDRIDRLLAAFGNEDNLLPYTVLIDAEGRLAWRHLGELKPAMLERVLATL